MEELKAAKPARGTPPAKVEPPQGPLRLIRKPAVADLTGLSPRSIDNKVRAGLFPAPVLLDARQCAWVEAEVDAWNRARVVDRDTGFIPTGRSAIIAGRRAGGKTAAKKRQPA